MVERLDKHILKNGMVVLGEPMETVESAAFDFMLPGERHDYRTAAAGLEVLSPTGFSEVRAIKTTESSVMHLTVLGCIAPARSAALI